MVGALRARAGTDTSSPSHGRSWPPSRSPLDHCHGARGGVAVRLDSGHRLPGLLRVSCSAVCGRFAVGGSTSVATLRATSPRCEATRRPRGITRCARRIEPGLGPPSMRVPRRSARRPSIGRTPGWFSSRAVIRRWNLRGPGRSCPARAGTAVPGRSAAAAPPPPARRPRAGCMAAARAKSTEPRCPPARQRARQRAWPERRSRSGRWPPAGPPPLGGAVDQRHCLGHGGQDEE